MAAHSLLASHNLTVLSSFFASIRNVLSAPEVDFAGEIERFGLAYDEGLDVMKEARGMWEEVDLSRGKGRLKRLGGTQEGGEGGASQQG